MTEELTILEFPIDASSPRLCADELDLKTILDAWNEATDNVTKMVESTLENPIGAAGGGDHRFGFLQRAA